jgi:hypothetical protein
VTTQKNRGTILHGDFCPGHMADIKGSEFVNSRIVEISPRLERD